MPHVHYRKHLFEVLPKLLFYLVLFSGFVMAFLACYLWYAPDAVGLQISLQVVALWAGAKFIYKYLTWRVYYVIVTSSRIVEHQGLLSQSDRAWNLTASVVECRQGLVDRFLGMGMIIITSFDGQTTVISGLENFAHIQLVLQG